MRIGFIGSGDIAGYMAWAARVNPRVAIAAVSNPDTDQATAFARRFAVPTVYGDYRKMLDEARPDAVYIATPHNLHGAMIRDAVAAGLHVLCEKPVTIDPDEAVELAGLARRRGVRVGVNYQYCYNRCCNRMIEVCRSGLLGSPMYTVVHVPWNRGTDYMRGWHVSRDASGGGTLLTQGSHCLDIAMRACGPSSDDGSEAATVRWAVGGTWNKRYGDAEVEDLAAGILELSNGAVIEICSSMVSVPERDVRIEVIGDRGTAVFRAGNLASLRILAGRRRLPVFDNAFSALCRSLEGFRRWIEEDHVYRTPIEDAIAVLRAVNMLYRSAETGCRIFAEDTV